MSTRRRLRRRRVRHAYPRPVVELVQMLIQRHAVREISASLDIPRSVIYRWRARAPGSGHAGHADASIDRLIARCNEIGFHFDARARRRYRPAPGPGAPAAHAEPATARYVFEAHKARPGREVWRRVEAARRVIEAEYFLEIDSATLAAEARMSRHHFIRVFGDAFGVPPHQYLLRVRVEAAKRLLLRSREPIEVVAAGVGFRSASNLARAFRRIEGSSVSDFCRSMMTRTAAAPTALPTLATPGESGFGAGAQDG
jgi:AraC-like DNA-binding protein